MKDACLKGDFDKVKRLLCEGADKEDGLYWACSCGNLNLVKYFVKIGANPCPPANYYNDYPLGAAFEKGHFEVVKFLVEKGAEVKVYWDLPFRTAALKGYLEIVKYFVEKGADVNIDDDYAICAASVRGHLDVVKFLVQKGADVKAKNNYPVVEAFYNGHYEIVDYLLQNGAKERLIEEKYKRYIALRKRVEIRAANKIGSWWIPICYDLNRESGQRMMERSWKRVEKMYEEKG
jgi:ankyrin repeat protein